MATSDAPNSAATLPSPAIMLQMITGYWTSQAIFAAAKLGIADLVKDGPKPCEELAPGRAVFYICEPAMPAEQVRGAGFAEVSDLGPEEANARYLANRADALRITADHHFMVARV